MALIFFYTVLIGGMALAAGAYLALLFVPSALIFRRHGPLAGISYTTALLGVLWATYEPPYGGSSLSYVPAAMRPNLFIVGTVQEPPTTMLAATAVIATAALLVLLIGWAVDRQARHQR